MTEPEGVTVRVREVFHLYKWDAAVVGESPPDPTQVDAAAHPGCAEIWEMAPGEPAKCIYRRD
jgi:hypothetical protein